MSSDGLSEVQDATKRRREMIGSVRRQAQDARLRGFQKAAAPMPQRIGRYRILGVVGRGGMGVVYRAEQQQPKRVVALKVLRQECLSSSQLRRFAYEAEHLGRLQHPGIARIYEADVAHTPQGSQPFLAMELIEEGQTLTEYATQHQLSTRQRLLLLVKVCDAVQHAHQQGIIHRDLKPANIIVDQSGQPKILDFGVARATNSDIQLTTIQTDVGQLIGTLPYMSPEQAQGESVELDTRSDIYSLGVIGYELLADRLPYDVQDKMIHEAVRIIVEEQPVRLSAIDRSLRGDVETILRKALEKDRDRRYHSAAEFGADIERYLQGRAITAKSDSGWYVLRKALYRRRRSLGIVAAGCVVAISGIFYALYQAHRHAQADRNRVTALRPYFRAERMIERRQGMALSQWRELAVEALRLLDEAIEIDPKFSGAYYQRGRVRLQLLDWANAKGISPVVERAIVDFESADRVAGAAGFPPALWEAGKTLCECYAHEEKELNYGDMLTSENRQVDRAKKFFRQAASLDARDPYVNFSRAMIASLDSTQHRPWISKDAIALLQGVITDPIGKHFDEAHFLLALILADLHGHYWLGMRDVILIDKPFSYGRRSLNRAEKHIKRAIALDSTDDVAWWVAAIIARRLDRHADAEARIRRALELKPHSIPWRVTLGHSLAVAGRAHEARDEVRELTVLYPTSSYCWDMLARANHWIQDYPAMEVAARRALDLSEDNQPAWSNLILALWKQGSYRQAERQFTRAIHLHPDNFGARMNRAEGLYAEGRDEEALHVYVKLCRLNDWSYLPPLNRARVLKSLGFADEALICLQEAVRRDKEPVPCADLICEYLCSDHPENRDTSAGLELATEVESIPFRDSLLRRVPLLTAMWSLAHYRAGRFDQALRRAVEIDDVDAAGCWARLVDAASFHALGQQDAALSSLRSAEDLLALTSIDDKRLLIFYEEVAARLGEKPQPFEATRPRLHETPF